MTSTLMVFTILAIYVYVTTLQLCSRLRFETVLGLINMHTVYLCCD